MKKLIALISFLSIFVSCDFLSDLVNGGEDTSELDYTYSKDYIEGAHTFFFKDGNFVIFTPDSLSGYYICIDSLDLTTGVLAEDPFYAQCDSLMRPVFANYNDEYFYFSNYTDNSFDLTAFIDGQEYHYSALEFESGAPKTKGSTEGSSNLDKAGDVLGILGIAAETASKGWKGFLIEGGKFIGLKWFSNNKEYGQYGPFADWGSNIAGIILDPKNKLGIAGLAVSGLQAMEATAELYSGLRIGNIKPYIEGIWKIDENSVKVVFRIEEYSSGTKDVPIGTIHHKKDDGAWEQGENHHINGTTQYYEETFTDLKAGRHGFRCIVYPSLFIGHPLLQQYYGFKTAISYVDISPVFMSELSLQSTTRQDDLILASVKIKLDFLSEMDKTVMQYSDDYGVCIIQDGKKDFYSAKDPENAGNEFYITLNLPFSDFQEIGDNSYKYYGDLKFHVYYTSSGYQQLRDERVLDIIHNEDDRWVDLGLSVLWAKYNVGATSPEEYGGYYAWGETETKSSYTWENYKFYKYYDRINDLVYFENIGTDISNTIYDVCAYNDSSGARLPTVAEIRELISNCLIENISYNNVKGKSIIGKNGNGIFLPLAGYYDYSEVNEKTMEGLYWSSTVEEDQNGQYSSAYGLFCSKWGYDFEASDCFEIVDFARYIGVSVRPVKDK
ncbi:MAG: hypothetical protein II989_00955 [Bacteroidales bacterium]|nr:hypothetical protein [Bacteroidales bacterium]